MTDQNLRPESSDVSRQLEELPDLAALLPELLIGGPTPTGGARRPPGSRPPVDLDAVALLDERERTSWLDGMAQLDPDGSGILPYLWGWARDIEATLLDQSPQLPDELPEVPSIAGLCAWLLRHLDPASQLPQWGEFAYGIGRLHARVHSAVARLDPPDRRLVCTRSDCRENLRAIEGRQDLWECGAKHLVHIQPVTLPAAAKATGENLRTIQRWAAAGKLAVILESKRHRLVDLGQVRGLAAARRLRENAT